MRWTRLLSKRPPTQPRSRGSRSTRNPIRVNRRIITRPCPILATLNNRWHPLGLVRLLKCVPLRPAVTNNNCSSSSNNNTTITTTRTAAATIKCSSSSHRSCLQLITNNTTTTTTTTITTITIDRRITTITDLEVLDYRLRHRIKRLPWCQHGLPRRRMDRTRPTQVRTACRPII